MELVCSLPGCQARSTEGNVTFYNFPKEAGRQIKWLEKLNLEEQWKYLPKALLQTMLICSAHFDKRYQIRVKSEYETDPKYILSRDAVPRSDFGNHDSNRNSNSGNTPVHGADNQNQTLHLGPMEITPITFKSIDSKKNSPEEPMSFAHFVNNYEHSSMARAQSFAKSIHPDTDLESTELSSKPQRADAVAKQAIKRGRKSTKPTKITMIEDESDERMSMIWDPLNHCQVELEEDQPSSPVEHDLLTPTLPFPESLLESYTMQTTSDIISKHMADNNTTLIGSEDDPEFKTKVRRGRPKKNQAAPSTTEDADAKDGNTDLSCDICGQLCASRGSLWTHKQRHVNPQNRRCTLCGKGFTQKANMLRHVRSHLNDRQYKCQYCPEAFVARESVKCHEMKYHTGKFTFTCEVCNKGFYQTCNYKLHMRSHSGEKPYKCTWEDCDKAYKHSTELKNHLRKHSGERPYSCLVCHRTFAIRSCLKAHVNRSRGCGIQGGLPKNSRLLGFTSAPSTTQSSASADANPSTSMQETDSEPEGEPLESVEK